MRLVPASDSFDTLVCTVACRGMPKKGEGEGDRDEGGRGKEGGGERKRTLILTLGESGGQREKGDEKEGWVEGGEGGGGVRKIGCWSCFWG